MNMEDSPRKQSQHLIKEISPLQWQGHLSFTPLNSGRRWFIWASLVSPLTGRVFLDAWNGVKCVGEHMLRSASHIPLTTV